MNLVWQNCTKGQPVTMMKRSSFEANLDALKIVSFKASIRNTKLCIFNSSVVESGVCRDRSSYKYLVCRVGRPESRIY